MSKVSVCGNIEMEEQEPSMIYGTDGSAPLSRNVTSRFPLSIMDPRVGHADAVNGEDSGTNDMVSTLAALKAASY